MTSQEKLYPICSWENNQHKLFTELYRIQNLIDGGKAFELVDEEKRVKSIVEQFNEAPIKNGIVYGNYNLYRQVKSLINDYDARH